MKELMLAVAVGAAAVCMAGSAESVDMRVGTYNIRNGNCDKGTPNAWEQRRSDLVALLRKMDLDAFGLQEAHPYQTGFLKKALPEYAMVGEYRNANRRSGEGSPVFYRKSRFDAVKSGTFWLSETPDVPGSKSWETACPRVCSWVLLKDKKTGKAFCFANTHTDHKSALARKEGMLLIIRRMKEFAPLGTPIVFTGDHNCHEGSEPARAVANLLKDSIYATETPPKGPWRTLNAWQWRDKESSCAQELKKKLEKRSWWNKRIDYIYVSKSVKVKSHEVRPDARPGAKLYPSDHFPVMATIEL